MGTFNNKKIKNIQTKKLAFGVITFLTIIISIMVIIAMILDEGIRKSFLMTALIIVLNISIVLRYYPYFKNKMEFRDIDKSIYKLSYTFLEYLNFEKKEEKLKELFSAHLDSELFKFYTKCSALKLNYITVCKELLKSKTDVKYFAIYTLLDIAAEDNLYSIKEDDFIKEVCKLLKIPKFSFEAIKSAYLKKGLKEERKIIEEEARQKTAKEITKSFLPYNAYKILGVSTAVTKKQLKKAYRNLAKKYHPDKYHGQSDKLIQEMEDKFLNIKEAYDLLSKRKTL